MIKRKKRSSRYVATYNSEQSFSKVNCAYRPKERDLVIYNKTKNSACSFGLYLLLDRLFGS